MSKQKSEEVATTTVATPAPATVAAVVPQLPPAGVKPSTREHLAAMVAAGLAKRDGSLDLKSKSWLNLTVNGTMQCGAAAPEEAECFLRLPTGEIPVWFLEGEQKRCVLRLAKGPAGTDATNPLLLIRRSSDIQFPLRGREGGNAKATRGGGAPVGGGL